MRLRNQPTCHQPRDSLYNVARPIMVQRICEYIIFDRFLSQLRTTQKSPFTVKLPAVLFPSSEGVWQPGRNSVCRFSGDVGERGWAAARSFAPGDQSAGAAPTANLQDAKSPSAL